MRCGRVSPSSVFRKLPGAGRSSRSARRLSQCRYFAGGECFSRGARTEVHMPPLVAYGYAVLTDGSSSTPS